MANKKVRYKNKPISISLTPEQIAFVSEHNKFILSKFVQMHLQDYLYATEDLEEMERGLFDNHDKKNV